MPRGTEGDVLFRRRIGTKVLLTGDDDRDLERSELNDLLGYLGFNAWDTLAERAAEISTPGISTYGMVPGLETAAFALVQCWQRYPELMRFITDEIGVDGVRQIGGLSRREIGTKADMGHIWGAGIAVAFGRGIAMALGRVAGHEREADLASGMQFVRRLYRGLWDGPDQPLFSSMRGYHAPVLESGWLARFADERAAVEDPDARARYHRFDADTERMARLLHFGSRLGRQDSGPYRTADGGVLIVRDHFLSDDLYHWADVAADLPHAVTQAVFLAPDVEVAVDDTGTAGVDLARHLTGIAVYARDRWDTPVRLLDDAELDAVQARSRSASAALERRILSMCRRDRVMAGGQVYYADLLAPFARAAGLWERLRAELDFFEWDPVASEAYYPLVTGGMAVEMVPRLLLTGAGFPPVKDAISGEEAFPALHLLALRGRCTELPVDPNDLVSAGLVSASGDGYLLTEAGKAVHQRQLINERRSYETERMAQAYERFLAQDGLMRALVERWPSADDGERAQLFAEATEILTRVRVALRRTNEQLLRFEGYLPRLRKALGRVEHGEYEYLADPAVDSFYSVWVELHADYLLTQGITRQ